MSDFRFSLEDYGLNYYPHEGVCDEQDYIDWSKVECVEIDWVTFVRKRTCEPTEEGCCPHCGEDIIKYDVAIGAGGGAVELDPPMYHNYCPQCGSRVKAAKQ